MTLRPQIFSPGPSLDSRARGPGETLLCVLFMWRVAPEQVGAALASQIPSIVKRYWDTGFRSWTSRSVILWFWQKAWNERHDLTRRRLGLKCGPASSYNVDPQTNRLQGFLSVPADKCSFGTMKPDTSTLKSVLASKGSMSGTHGRTWYTCWQNYRHSSVDIKYSGSVSTFATLSLKNKSQEIKYLTALLNNVPNQSPCPQWAISRPLLGALHAILILHTSGPQDAGGGRSRAWVVRLGNSSCSGLSLCEGYDDQSGENIEKRKKGEKMKGEKEVMRRHRCWGRLNSHCGNRRFQTTNSAMCLPEFKHIYGSNGWNL